MQEVRLRLFVSSPKDVRKERDRVDVVADRLNGEFEGRAHIQVFRWEHAFYGLHESFQDAINAAVDNMRGTDMVVCIVWKRIGSELDPQRWHHPDGTPIESGTVFEVETALEVRKQTGGAPDVFLFRKEEPVTYGAETYEEDHKQHELLKAVLKRGMRPARTKDDFPAPLAPVTSRNGVPAS